ncbi:MAG TPA: hypothetical protein VJ279_05715, partial [Hanamia sp.]|nr:hypothetical protein [Hanamia sp.]
APGMMQKIAPFLNAMLFSPRLQAARLNMLTYWARPSFWNNAPKEIKTAYFADISKFAAFGMAIMGLASLYAAYSGDDDKDKISVDWFTPTSADWGKIKKNNTRMDVWAGYQQYLRLAATMAAGYTTTQKGVKMRFGEGYKADTRWDVISRTLRGKASPPVSMMIDLMGGEDMVGNKIKYEMGIGRPEKYKEMTIDRYIGSHILPMSIIGTVEAIRDTGGAFGAAAAIGGTLGVGVQTYDNTTKPVKSSNKNNRSSRSERKGRLERSSN